MPAERLPPALPNEGAYAASGTNVAVAGSHVWIGTTAARVLHSADRGKTWTVAQTPVVTSASAGIFSIAFRDALHGIVVGGDYQKEGEAVDNAAVTSDGGKTWTLVKGLTGYRSAVAYVPGSKQSWLAVGPLGSDLSTDDGNTWTADTWTRLPRVRLLAQRTRRLGRRRAGINWETLGNGVNFLAFGVWRLELANDPQVGRR